MLDPQPACHLPPAELQDNVLNTAVQLSDGNVHTASHRLSRIETSSVELHKDTVAAAVSHFDGIGMSGVEFYTGVTVRKFAQKKSLSVYLKVKVVVSKLFRNRT